MTGDGNVRSVTRVRLRRRVLVLFGMLLAMVLTACGGGGSQAPAGSSATAAGGGGGGGSSASCSPHGTSLQISAKNMSFDKKCLAAPANKAFTITFHNQENGLPHDVTIYNNSSATKKLFGGSPVTGPKTATYHVPAMKPGTYYFRCDIHPTQMTGTFVVK